MGRKTQQKDRMQQYREILAEHNTRLEDCKVLGFEFGGPGGPALLHYELMHPLRPVYHLFDAVGTRAYVVVPKDEENMRACISLAESCGGERISPITLLK